MTYTAFQHYKRYRDMAEQIDKYGLIDPKYLTEAGKIAVQKMILSVKNRDA